MSAWLADQLTIVLPTCNRHDRLLRLLNYYYSFEDPAQVHLLDSSQTACPDELAALAQRRPGLTLKRYPAETPPLAKMLEGLRAVTTPYVVLWADDDFMVPGAFADAVRLLEARPDISVAHGRSALFHQNPQGPVQWVDPYPQQSILEATASDRLRHHLRRYSVMFYSVHRATALQRSFEQVCTSGLDWHTWGEIALSSLAVIQGRAMAMPRLYMLKEGHAGMTSAQVQAERGLDLFDWLTDSVVAQAHGSYEQFRDCLLPELMRQDSLDRHRAREVVKQAFWPYFVRGMEEKWSLEDGHNAVRFHVRLRDAATRVPGLRTAWRTARAWMPHRPSAISLDALRQPSSRYYRDFMPIYRAVTANGERP